MRWTLLLALLAVLVAAAAPPAPPDDKKSVPLPPEAIVVIADTFAEAMKLMPKGVWLTPERFRQLLEAEEKLRKLAGRPAVRAPSKCVVKGKVEGGLAHLQATFDFDTDRPGTFVRLACAQGSATGISLNGRTPALVNDPSKGGGGFAVEVDRPGDHQLTLDLVVPLAPRPGGQGLALDLPRAAITAIDIALPPSSRDVRLNGKTPAEARVSLKGGRLEADSLGPAERIDINWRSPSAATAGAVLAADGTVTVRVDPVDTVTEAQLTLRVLAGQTRLWPLLVPAGAEVVVDPADAARVERIDSVDQKALHRRTVRLKADSADPLRVTVRTSVRTPTPGSGKPATVGPFTVVNVAGQSGTIHVINAAPDLHLDLAPHGDLRRRALTDEESRKTPALVAAFAYGPSAAPGAGWLDLETERVRGQVLVKPTHTLRLADDGDPGPAWLVETELTVIPRWADIDRFLVHLPVGCDFVPDGSHPLGDRVQSVSFDGVARSVEFRLNRANRSTNPFTVRVVCRSTTEVDPARDGLARLALPRPVGVVEPDCTLRVVATPRTRLVPADNPSGVELIRQTTHELLYRCPRRPPDAVAVGWGPYRPSVEVGAVVDVAIGVSDARVRHEFDFTFPDGTRPRQRLEVPPAVAPTLVIRQGDARLEGRVLTYAPPGKLVLEYQPVFDREALTVPLVMPEQAARVDTKVRVWGDGGRVPTRAPDGWAEANVEEVPGRPRLPVMVLRSSRPERSLRLDLGADDPTSRVLIERALARVEVAPGGAQEYRISYRVARLAGPSIDLELPAPPASIGLLVTLDGKAIDPVPLPADRPELKGLLVRLKLSADLVQGSSVLELSYQLSADRQTVTPVTTTLQVPRLRDEGAVFPTRWQVVVPANWVIVGPEPATGVPRVWARTGWLFAPRVGVTGADLERWLLGATPPDAVAEAAGEVVPSTVLWRETDAPVMLAHVPRQGWLVGCSAALVLLGLVGMRLAWGGPDGQGSYWAWPAGLLVMVAALLAVLFYPGMASAIAYGVQPGLLVLVALVPAGWLLAERRRRQVVFLANFSRSKSASSPPRPVEQPEASTVDVPRARGSSLERQGS